MAIFVGSGVAIATPFHNDGTVNYNAYEKHIDFLIQNGTDAIVTCGTTGEASTLSDEEHLDVIRSAVSATAGRVPVIAGAGSNDTKHGVELCKDVQKTGADALLLVTPYYNKCTQEGLVKHFRMQAEGVDIPSIVYNVPSRTTVNILPSTMYELSKISNIVGVKEASSNIVQIAETAEVCGPGFDLYSGNDDQIVPILSLGGIGVITVIGNIAPKQVHDMVEHFLNGSIKESTDLQLKSLALVRALFTEVNPIPVKAALNLMGFEAGPPRMPLTEISAGALELLKKEMKAYGLIS